MGIGQVWGSDQGARESGMVQSEERWGRNISETLTDRATQVQGEHSSPGSQVVESCPSTSHGKQRRAQPQNYQLNECPSATPTSSRRLSV